MRRLVNRYIRFIGDYLECSYRDEFWISVFCKSLYSFVGIKIIALRLVYFDLVSFVPFSFSSIKSIALYAPLAICEIHPLLFIMLFAGLVLAAIIYRVNAILGFFVFWFSLSFSRLCLPVLNGSDMVLNLFLFFGIFLPVGRKGPGRFTELRLVLSRFMILLAKVHISLIYFHSGFDKLLNSAWRSGDVWEPLVNLTFYFNPFIQLNTSHEASLLFSWGVIVFELAFATLVWIRPVRFFLLIIGMLFHALTIVFLGLVDFGIVMILCYSIYFVSQRNPVWNWWK